MPPKKPAKKDEELETLTRIAIVNAERCKPKKCKPHGAYCITEDCWTLLLAHCLDGECELDRVAIVVERKLRGWSLSLICCMPDSRRNSCTHIFAYSFLLFYEKVNLSASVVAQLSNKERHA